MRIVAFGMHALSPFSVAALRAARAAGEIHRASFRRGIRVDFKGRNDPVTEADRASEAAIVEMLRSTFPDHAFLGEEGGPQGKGEYTWLIDPLDGTFNFARAIPWFAVSIALERNGRPIAGVILNTIFGEVYAAEADRGAFAAELADLPADPGGWGDLSHWRRLRVPGTTRLDQAVLSTGFPHDVAETRINLDHFTNLVLGAGKIRNMGSAALSLAAIALGQFEGYWEIGPHAWDFAAGALLVEEAGGRVTDLRGRRLDLHGRQILATNGGIHDAVVAVLAKGRSGLD
ncbi:MAG TPA: inositol monophosphatase family protein [bacterium]|nr:inositol monophosphatase family protein [bacterium]